MCWFLNRFQQKRLWNIQFASHRAHVWTSTAWVEKTSLLLSLFRWVTIWSCEVNFASIIEMLFFVDGDETDKMVMGTVKWLYSYVQLWNALHTQIHSYLYFTFICNYWRSGYRLSHELKLYEKSVSEIFWFDYACYENRTEKHILPCFNSVVL